MLPRRNYDFSEMETIMFNLRDNHGPSQLNRLKNELNKFFNDSTCIDILYTQNTDKLFFGMCVFPKLTGDDAVKIIQTNDKMRIDKYYIEIDSKLLDPVLGLNKRELVAVLLHEVGHLVNDSTPIEELRKALDEYMMANNENIIITDSIHYRELLAYGFKDTLRKMTSMFEFVKKDEEQLADEFVIIYGYGADLCSAFDKLKRNIFTLNMSNNVKLSTLIWTLRLYKDVKHRRIAALKTMRKGKTLSPSTIEKKELDMVCRRLERIDDEALIESVIDELKNKYASNLRDIKLKGIRSIEDDYYEYSVRVNNIEDQEEALLLLRQINSKLAILDDYISTEEMSDKERERWISLMHRIEEIRYKLKDKKFDNSRYYSAVIVNYPDIK